MTRPPTGAELLEELRRWLRRHPGDEAELDLPRTKVTALADELGRLTQSNDRLRRQNRRLRGKHGETAADPGDVA